MDPAKLLDGDGRDRAYLDALIRLGRAPKSLLIDLRAASLRAHADLRRQIASGLRGASLRASFDAIPAAERDHYVEEVLGIAYPPLEEREPVPELIAYTPSGYDEIVHAFDLTRPAVGEHFIDLGSGMGKAVLLAALLTEAASAGVDRDRVLHELAVEAAGTLGVSVDLQCADVRDVAIERADIVFMYLPFTGSVLESVLTRLHCRCLCTGAVDLGRYRDLTLAGATLSWLHVYERSNRSSSVVNA